MIALLPGYFQLEELFQQFGDVQGKIDLGVFCSKIGQLSLNTNDLVQAETYIAKEVSLAGEVVAHDSTAENRYSLALALCSYAKLWERKNNRREKDNAYQEAYDLLDQLDDETDGAAWVQGAMQAVLKEWNPEPKKQTREFPIQWHRTQTKTMKNAAYLIRLVEFFTATCGFASVIFFHYSSGVKIAAGIVFFLNIICHYCLQDDNFMISYILGGLIGFGIGTIRHGGNLEAACTGICVVAALWILLRVGIKMMVYTLRKKR